MIRRIPTRSRNPIRRAGARLWQACEDHQWLPMLIALAALLVVNSTWLN